MARRYDTGGVDWAERAGAAERAITERHLRPVCGLPGTALGCLGWPPEPRERFFIRWGYWWQAHLLDCLVDAQLRAPDTTRLTSIGRLLRSIGLRNVGRWTNDYYDDIAWLGLAVQRVAAVTGRDLGGPQRAILRRLRSGWTDDGGGGIWWRRGDMFKNAPANGPAAIMHARAGEIERARAITDWMESRLVDPRTGLVADGLRLDTGKLVQRYYSYCQGVFLGACLELGELDAAARTVRAVAEHCVAGGVLRGAGGGDGGLFAGILARYLALAALQLPEPASGTARELVLASAQACWSNTIQAPGGPLFGPEWNSPAPEVSALPGSQARDLSVQLSGWMLLEAAARLSQQ
ncbi:MAG: glycoside hydrolase family 76 protein [Sciscionella sp.]